MFPRELSEWNYNVIKELAERSYLETNTIEFKPALKSRSTSYQEKEKFNNRILQTTCAFANTNGGFIVFGLEDMGKNKQIDLIGLEKSDDLPKEFGDKIKAINPIVDFDFKNPPIEIPRTEKVLFVVQILQSIDRPHINTKDRIFYYRTNNGNEPMSHEQIKESFLRYEDRRHKLNLLYIELLSNSKIAEELLRTANLGIIDVLNFSPHKFEVSLLTSLLPDVYNIIYNDRETLVSLIKLRLQMLTINSKISIYHSHAPDENGKATRHT